jgi:hypothetical protein
VGLLERLDYDDYDRDVRACEPSDDLGPWFGASLLEEPPRLSRECVCESLGAIGEKSLSVVLSREHSTVSHQLSEVRECIIWIPRLVVAVSAEPHNAKVLVMPRGSAVMIGMAKPVDGQVAGFRPDSLGADRRLSALVAERLDNLMRECLGELGFFAKAEILTQATSCDAQLVAVAQKRAAYRSCLILRGRHRRQILSNVVD